LTAIRRSQQDAVIARTLSIAGAALAALALAACGGSSDKSTTARTATAQRPPSAQASPSNPAAAAGLDAHVLKDGDLPGFTAQVIRAGTTPDEWAQAENLPPEQQAKEAAKIKRLGFVSGLSEQLASSNGTPVQALSLVERFRSPAAANQELAHQIQSSKASGGYKAFPVPGIPGARGFDGSDGQSSGHNVAFTDGVYYHLVGAGWPTGTPNPPTRAKVISAAQRLYRRVHR